ncbi:MAG TPA: hypothetical protein VMF06_10850 [Candidatus Limnocylindria bacterium]|nr:hypothetical protein [Candidatus Limnocylindria bacterium]
MRTPSIPGFTSPLRMGLWRGLLLGAVWTGVLSAVHGTDFPNAPLRIERVRVAVDRPDAADSGIIFEDHFDQAPNGKTGYLEFDSKGESFQWGATEGMRGGGLRCQFEKGQVDAGHIQVLFGKNPLRQALRPNDTFHEIYWRIYVKHEVGWSGNPAKLGRATCLAGRDRSQGLIAHLWGGKGDVLCMDPATGIRDNQKITTRYNDFAHLKWLGLRNGLTPIFSTQESGRWVCVESHVRLNTPGKQDGVFEFWVDGKLEASRDDLDWHGTWEEYAINAVFIENYWNDGSVKRQARRFDNFVVSTRPIGPIVAEIPLQVTRTQGTIDSPWEMEIASDPDGKDLVWKSKPQGGDQISLIVDTAKGAFTGSRLGLESLARGKIHRLRHHVAGEAAWSSWHSPFRS